MEIALKDIRIDGGTQPRSKIDEALVAEYASAMEGGATFPQIAVFFDGVDHWLADGFHRYHAANSAHIETLDAAITNGTRRDAVLHSVGANTAHGQRRTNKDKRRAVMTLLGDPEWVTWSDREIARRCGVHTDVVVRVKSLLPVSGSEKKFTDKHGNVSTMRTKNIGKRVAKDGREIVLPAGREHADVRAEQIRRLAVGGHVAEQIAKKLGISEQQVRNIAKKFNVGLPDQALGKRQRFASCKAIESAVLELDSCAATLRVLPISLGGITPEQALEWAESIAESIKQFSAFERKLRKHHHGK